MAKFIELTCYYPGFANNPEKRFVNMDKVRWIKGGATPYETRLVFHDQLEVVLKSKIEDVLKLINLSYEPSRPCVVSRLPLT